MKLYKSMGGYRAGDRIVFRRGDGKLCEDVIRCFFMDHVLLEPYARNYEQPAAVLTEHSWTPLSSIVKKGGL
jgi:hypothetical protein